MIRDIVRTVCLIAAMAVAASLVVETRRSLAVIDLAHRHAATATIPVYAQAPPQSPPSGPLARLGAATVGLADAALGVVR
jgi:hypothetical protein